MFIIPKWVVYGIVETTLLGYPAIQGWISGRVICLKILQCGQPRAPILNVCMDCPPWRPGRSYLGGFPPPMQDFPPMYGFFQWDFHDDNG